MGMHGIHHMPALYFNTPFTSADQINLSRYKNLINKPLMKNIQEELQHHVLKENKLQVKTIMVTSFTGKEAQNSEEHKKTC